MTTVGIFGAQGKMGKRLVSLLEAGTLPALQFGGAFDSRNGFQKEIFKNIGAFIDFSSPQAFTAYAPWIREFRKPLVMGTTGYSPEAKKEIEKLSESVPLLISPNMSIGMNILFELVNQADPMIFGNFSSHIIETHHTQKKDTPSGSALELAQCLKSQKTEITSLRIGDIVGEHTVLFFGMGERLELTHRAITRDIFARGALQAAEWLIHQPSGLYSMRDFLTEKGTL